MLKKLLIFVLLLGNGDQDLIVAASNSAFLLNLSGVDFSGLMLCGIVVKDTDLSCGKFIGTNMAFSQFHKVVLIDCDFSCANFTGATWIDVHGLQIADFNRSETEVITFSKSGNILASTENNMIGIWGSRKKNIPLS